jgi:hypothetical protein
MLLASAATERCSEAKSKRSLRVGDDQPLWSVARGSRADAERPDLDVRSIERKIVHMAATVRIADTGCRSLGARST